MSLGPGLVLFRWEGKRPRLVLHEKYERGAKWTLRALTAVGVLTSMATLPPLGGLALALALLVAEQLLEKAVFVYSSLYLRALPFLGHERSKWTGMAFLWGDLPSGQPLSGVGLAFSDADYARRFFEYLRSWNDDSVDDPENNIRMSFVIDEDLYYVFLFPSPDKASAKKFFADAGRKLRKDKRGKEHVRLMISTVLQNSFSTMHAFGLGDFLDRCKPGQPFQLLAVLNDGVHEPAPISSIRPIEKRHFRSKARVDLTRDDLEYHYWRTLVAK